MTLGSGRELISNSRLNYEHQKQINGTFLSYAAMVLARVHVLYSAFIVSWGAIPVFY